MRVQAFLRPLAHLTGAGILLLGSLAAHADDLQDITRLVTSGSYAPALDKVNAYLGAHPKDAQGRFLKGIILTETGKQSDAIQIFSALTEEFPELPEPYNNLAVIYASQGQYEKARNALELAIHTHPSYGTAHENLGDVYAKLATKSYDKALQLDKGNTTAAAKLNLIKALFEKPAAGSTAATATTTARAEPADTHGSDAKPDAKGKAAKGSAEAKAEPARPAAGDTAGAVEAARAWAAAWSSKDAEAYLAFYAANFHTPGGLPRGDWEKQRRERLGKPGPITVHLQDVSVKGTGKDDAEVSFRQKYDSSNLKSVNLKTLVLHRQGDKWQIVEERVRG